MRKTLLETKNLSINGFLHHPVPAVKRRSPRIWAQILSSNFQGRKALWRSTRNSLKERDERWSQSEEIQSCTSWPWKDRSMRETLESSGTPPLACKKKLWHACSNSIRTFGVIIKSWNSSRYSPMERPFLEISCGFQLVYGCWVCIDWTELPFEFISEVFPINKFMIAYIFWFLLPSKYASRPLSCLFCLHVEHGPDNFGLFVWQGVQTKTDIDLAGIKEHHSLGVVSVELWWKGQF